MSLYPHATEMTLPQWRELLAEPDARIRSAFVRLYGDNAHHHADRLALFRTVIEAAAARLPCEVPTTLIRVPGRINTMGLHSDGQYSYKNHVVFGREMVAAVQRREDDIVALHSPHDGYRDVSVSLANALPPEQRGREWLDIVESANIEIGAWQNYLVGPILALQSRFPETPFRGMNLLVDGDIPVAAGVSSSSALTTLAGIATLYLNQLDLSWGEAIRILGAGEWYSGTRGGPGDTGAQMLCRCGHILHIMYDIAFEPYEEHHIPFPDDWRIVLCNTLVLSRKAVESRDAATSRGLAQAAGMVILRDRFPDLLGPVKCLAHITPENLGISLGDVYRMLKALPERASMDDLRQAAPKRQAEMEPVLRRWRVALPDFPLRQVCMYMICEPARGARNRDAVMTRDEEQLRQLMAAAHDGDRVVRWTDDSTSVAYDNSAADERLEALAEWAESADPAERVSAQLCWHPGGFRCSCPELDLLVDICDSVDGVIGSRITGAGLGGCMFAYVHKDAVDEVLKQVEQRYYEPRGLPAAAWKFMPTERGGPLRLE